MEGDFEVVIRGFKLNGPERPARVIERVLGESEASARALIKSFPVVVRRGLSRPSADALAAELRAGGARAEVRESDAAVGAAAPTLVEAGEGAEPSLVEPKPPTLVEASGEGAEPSLVEPKAPTLVEASGEGAEPSLVEPSAADAQPSLLEPGGARAAASEADRQALLPSGLPAVRGAPASSVASIEPAESLGKYQLGTLKIVLPNNAPPPAPAKEPCAETGKSEPAPAPTPEELLHGTGMLDDVFDDPFAERRSLELDEDALAGRAQGVSGGRAQNGRPSLMMRVRDSLVDIPLRVVRRARKHPQPAKRSSAGRMVALTLVLAALLTGGNYLRKWAGDTGSAARAQVASASKQTESLAQAARGAAEKGEGSGDDAPAPGLNPVLKLAPEPMQAPLASVMRKRVPGVHTVRVDWGPSGPPGAVQCVLVSGNAMEREERVRALLTTGARYPVSPNIEDQLRDHAEVLRMVEGEGAQFTPLCLKN